MDERKKQILKAVVEDYVISAEPVGSKSLIERHNLGVSSATIRHEMADLEAEGYLEKPYTSAGRIPSDKGYRSYVDELLEVGELPRTQAIAMRTMFKDSLVELTDLIRQATAVLSAQNDYVSLALTPKYANSRLRQVKLLMIEPGKVLVVVVLAAGLVKDRLVRISDQISGEQLDRLGKAIEEGLAGKKLSDITLVTVAGTVSGQPLADGLLNQVIYEAYVSIKQAEHLDLYVEGTHRLLAQPEYRDVDKAHRFMRALGEEKTIAGYIADLPAADDLACGRYLVRIGQEITLDGFEDTSFITSTYCVNGEVYGQIGVIGPRRMDYGRIISQIRFINRQLHEATSDAPHISKDNHEA
ncbi:MAG TPA: heat-inducible transcription repressor HrcA [Clostridiaceae bacterium]|nr:heat-inducible transcription repressor HrcA [Clostridiaceae bacterium]